jgi:lysophospholipase L1-like esterase
MTTRSPLTSGVINASIVLSSICFALLVCEGAVRVLKLAPEITAIDIEKPYAAFTWSSNPILKYEPKPNSSGINSAGLRDRDFPRHKPPGVKRIVVLGDSIGFGFCNDSSALPIEQTFAKRLEMLLNESEHQKVEVINFSVSGYDTLQEAEMLRTKAIHYNPDLVIISVCLNDTWEASAELADFRSKRSPEISSGATTIEDTSASTVRKYMFRHSDLFRWASLILKSHNPENSAQRTGWEGLARGFSLIRETANNTSVMAVVFPLFDGFSPYRHLGDHERIKAVGESLRFSTLDLLPTFQSRITNTSETLQAPCNREHPNAAGHDLAARELLRFIQDKRLL